MNDVDELWHGRAQALTMLLTIHSYARERPAQGLIEPRGSRRSAGGSPKYEDEGYGAADVTKRGWNTFKPMAIRTSLAQRCHERISVPYAARLTLTMSLLARARRRARFAVPRSQCRYPQFVKEVDEEESVQQELCAEGLL
ncbi:hypothetical protein HRG_012473 [Hirsutella rhossiliensis]